MSCVESMSMRVRTCLLAVTVAVAAVIAPASVPTAEADPTWAPRETATIHPGVWTASDSGECTANFVFYDATDIYIGSAAHCTGRGEPTDTNGCITKSRPLGSEVEIEDVATATLVYSSWIAMQKVDEQNFNACRYNDFALLELDPADHDKVNPTIPFWYGPDGASSSSPTFSEVYAFGNSFLKFGISPMTGYSVGDVGDGWGHVAYFVTPGVPGDSGSAVLNADGDGLGVLATLSVTGANTSTDLLKAITYMESHGGPDVTLATGTLPFEPLF